MAYLNEVRLIGRLTRDPELRSTASGQPVCSIGLVTNRKYRAQDGTLREDSTFIDITCWGKLADTASRYLKKGRQVFIGGRLRFESWQDRQTGQKRSKLSVVADALQFLDSQFTQKAPEDGHQQWTPNQHNESPSQWTPPPPPPQPVDNSPGWEEPDVGEPPF